MKPTQSDYGTPERHRHGDEIREIESTQAGIKRAYVVTQTPLSRYFVRGQLGTPHEAGRRLEAGDRLYSAFHRGGLSNRTTGSYQTRISGDSPDGYRILSLDAYNEYMKARDAIRTGCVGVVYDVVCQHKTAGSPARMECLKLGLDDVAKHWGIR